MRKGTEEGEERRVKSERRRRHVPGTQSVLRAVLARGEDGRQGKKGGKTCSAQIAQIHFPERSWFERPDWYDGGL